MNPEVLQHVKDGLEPKVLHPTLTVLVQRQTQMLEDGEGQRSTQVTAKHDILSPTFMLTFLNNSNFLSFKCGF